MSWEKAMKYKILEVGADGLLSFTKEELEALLEETYNAGYEDGRKTCQYPYWIQPAPYDPSYKQNNWWDTRPVWTCNIDTAQPPHYGPTGTTAENNSKLNVKVTG